MFLRLSKIVPFLQLFADVSKKTKDVTTIYVDASQSSRFALLKNDIGNYAMALSLEDISV